MGTFSGGYMLDPATGRPVVGRTVTVTSWPDEVPLTPDEGALATGPDGGYGIFTVDGHDAVQLRAGDVAQIVVSVEKQLEEALPGNPTGGTVKTVNGVEPDEDGNVEIEAGGVDASIDPADPLTLILNIPSNPSVTLSLSADGFQVTATFTGYSPDGLGLIYAVDWGDGTITSSATSPAVHTYPSTAATHTVTVTVTDSEGGAATDSGEISVAPPGLSAYGQQVYADDPIIYLPGSAEATPLADYMGVATATVLTGTVTSSLHALGDGDRSIKFDNAAVGLGQPAALTAPAALSFECLFQQSLSSAQGGMFTRNLVVGSRRRGAWITVTSTTGFRLTVGTASGAITTPATTPPTASEIHHVATTWDGTTWTLYVDGAAVGTLADTDSWAAAAPADIELGWSRSDASTQYGWMGGIAFYDHALTPARIAAHVAAAGL